MFLLTLLLAFSLASCGEAKEEPAATEKGEEATAEIAQGTVSENMLVVIAQNDFQDTEYKTVRDALTGAGFKVSVAAPEKAVASGVAGTRVEPDLALSGAKASGYLAVVFIGGPGVEDLFDMEDAHRLAREEVSGGKVLAAICLAPVILARSGVLSGKKATVYPSASHDLTVGGATFTGADVEMDGKIITASGPEASTAFAQAVLAALQ